MFNPRLQANYLAKTQDIAGKVGKRVSDTLDGIDATRVSSFAGLQLNEFLLYHGTPSKIAPLLQKQGLDPQRAGVHRGKMFGYGAYMATNSSKSDLYTEPTTLSADPRKKGERCILVVRACLGEPFRAARTNTQLRLPPDRPAAIGGVAGSLDSVVGLTRAAGGQLLHPEYIVYKEAQTLPEYAIWYEHGEKCRCTHCSSVNVVIFDEAAQVSPATVGKPSHTVPVSDVDRCC